MTNVTFPIKSNLRIYKNRGGKITEIFCLEKRAIRGPKDHGWETKREAGKRMV